MKTINQYTEIINKSIMNVSYPAHPHHLYDPIKYTMSHGGKRLRPVLTLLSCDAMGGNHEECINQALGVEFFHNFTLLHDDVMDNADLRRGLPTVHCKWDANTAILSGDAMLTFAGQLSAKCAPAQLPRVMQLFNDTAMEVYEGQQYDMDFENRDNVNVDEYISMIRLKTSVLIGCACKMGAIMAEAPQEKAELLYEFGVNLGLAFQLQDDLLDVYGDPATFGKAIGGDILNNKKTFLLSKAIEIADEKSKKELNKWIGITGDDNNTDKIASITAIYNQLGIPAICEHQIEQYLAIALKSIESLNLGNEERKSFDTFVEMIMHRKK